MHSTTRLLPLVALCVALSAAQARGARQFAATAAPAPPGSECPSPGFDAVEFFNVTDYISAPWYVLAQTPLMYQPVDQLYCTQARYIPKDPSNPLAGLQVINYSRKGGVDGEPVSTGSGPSLLASVPDLSQPSKLSVGFDFPGASTLVGTQFGSGPYWVIAAGEGEAGGYDWAIVSSGPPTKQGANGCVFADSFAGVWLFSRSPEDPELQAALTEMLAEDFGFDTSILVPVTQAGCTYADE